MDRRRFGREIAAGTVGLWGLVARGEEEADEEAMLPDSVECISTIAEMKQFKPEENSLLYVRGYYRPGDGGGGLFKWEAGVEREPDGGITFQSEAVKTTEGRWVRQWEGERLNVRWFGARGDLTWTPEASISTGSRRVQTSEEVFTPEDVGKSFVMNGQDGQVVAMIERYVDATTVMLDREAKWTITDRFASWGFDDAPAFNRAIEFANPAPVEDGSLQAHNEVPSYGVFVPDGDYLIESPVVLREGVILVGSSVFGSRLNISFAANGGDHRIRSYFHDNKSAADAGSSYPHLQKNYGIDNLGIRPRPAERNPSEEKAFIYVKFGIEFYIKHSYLSQSNSYSGGTSWNTIGLVVEKNVDLNLHDVVFEGGRYGVIAREPTEKGVQGAFGLRGGRIGGTYFYNQKRCSCLLRGVYNTHLSDCSFKYYQDFGVADRTAIMIQNGKKTPSRDLLLSDVYVNGYWERAKLQHGLYLAGDRHQVTGMTVKQTEGEGVVLDGKNITVSGFFVTQAKGDAVHLTERSKENVLSGGSIVDCGGVPVQLDGSAVITGLDGEGEQSDWIQGEQAVVVGRDGVFLPGGWKGGRIRIGNQYLWEQDQTLRIGSTPPQSPESGKMLSSRAVPAGTSSERPDTPDSGEVYFDQDLGHPIWWSGKKWVDALGREVE